MKIIDVSRFSEHYNVRVLTVRDMEDILWLMKHNEQYFRYSGGECSAEQVMRDMAALPPGKSPTDKRYVGYYDGDYLVAVLDFVDGYPDSDTAYIGFFMLDHLSRGEGKGTAIMEKLIIHCWELGYKRVMLGWEKANPQSSRFWQRMCFEPLREVEMPQGTVVEGQRLAPKAKKEWGFGEFLLEQAKLHPSMQARDALKLCYQAAHGAEHGITDPAAARKWLRQEMSAAETHGHWRLYEQISPGLCRVDLGAWKNRKMDWKWLYNMFVSAKGTGEIEPMLKMVEDYAAEGKLPFSEEDWKAELETWDGGPVSHSEAYRAAEKPHYRIVPMRFANAMRVMEKMAEYPEGCCVAIDGRSNSGKSTLAAALEEATEAGVVHMDDLCTPASRGQVTSLGLPGGNVNYHLFRREVLPHIHRPEAFSYPYYDARCIKLAGRRRVRRSKWRIVEGSYSQHSVFGGYMDIRVFVTTDIPTQRRRLIARDGEDMAASYFWIWLPQEEEYFDFFKLDEKADVLIKT